MVGRSVLITGATSGIGRSAAAQLVEAGWDVWVTGRSLERATAVAAEVGGRALELDVTDGASIAAAAAAVDHLDALVNNAGVQPDYGVGLLDADPDLLRTAYETNVFGVVAVTNALLPALRRSSSPRIVNVSSGTASFGWSTGPNPQFDHEAAAAVVELRHRMEIVSAERVRDELSKLLLVDDPTAGLWFLAETNLAGRGAIAFDDDVEAIARPDMAERNVTRDRLEIGSDDAGGNAGGARRAIERGAHQPFDAERGVVDRDRLRS